MIVRLVYRRVIPEKVLAGTEIVDNRWWWGGGGVGWWWWWGGSGGNQCLTLHCHHQNDSAFRWVAMRAC